jgi:carbonic anhydrase
VTYVVGVALTTASAAAQAGEPSAHWSYSGASGPEHWAAEDPSFAICGTGQHQSPIDIKKAVAEPLPAIEFAYQAIPLKVTDTGHSFQVNVPAGSGGIRVGGEHYDLVQFHFHRPSEERIQGDAYPMVAHLVHKSAKGGLAVVAVLIRTGETNTLLKSVFDHFPSEGTKETSVPGATLNLNELLPRQRGYYTFDGSLTTPPCTEHVRWFVLKSPAQASAAQVEQFAARYPNNARPVQPLNDRTVAKTSD